MLQPMTLEDKFYTFVACKDPNEFYNWNSTQWCACGQFCTWAGIAEYDSKARHQVYNLFNSIARGGVFAYRTYDGTCRTYGGTWTSDMAQREWTFGALRSRLDAARADMIRAEASAEVVLEYAS